MGYTIGFSNLNDRHPFASIVRRSLEDAAAAHPDIRLIVRDNAMDNDRASANAREFAAMPVDLVIHYHLDERANPKITAPLSAQRIPIIAVDVPVAPWVTYFGANNRQVGLMVGAALGRWIGRHWDGQVDKVAALTVSRVLGEVRQRVEAAVAALSETTPLPADNLLYLDSGNLRETTAERFAPLLERWSGYRRIAIIGFNDDTAVGALDAARSLGREGDVVAVGHGADLAISWFKRPGSRLIASSAFFPERYGERLLDLAQRMLRGESVPRFNYIDHVCVTPDSAGISP